MSGPYGSDILDVDRHHTVTCGEACSDCLRNNAAGTRASLRASATSRYLAANIVYLVYALLIVWIDQVGYPRANGLLPAADDDSVGTDDYTDAYAAYDSEIAFINR